MFWGLVLKTNKRYSQHVTKGFSVTQAILDINTVNDDSVVQVWLNTDDTDHLLANVNRKASQVALNLSFNEGETVAFYCKGNGTVYLSGYLLPDDEFGHEFDDDDEDESEVETIDLPQKKKAKHFKKGAIANSNSSDDDDEDADISLQDGDDLDDSNDDEDDDDDEEDEDDDDDIDDDELDDEEEEEIKSPPAKQAKIEKIGKQNGLPNGKQKKEDGEQKPKDKNKQKPQQPENNQKNQQKTKILSNGVVAEDVRVGKGPEAKVGKKLTVYYEGRLKSGKVFDSTKSGEGFTFALGRGEVIRGWDIGIAGMKVGGKRKITCPPSVAYGNKGHPPVIPGNSTLIFDIELRGIK